MNITWLGHSGFRIEVGDQILLVDPWLAGNPAFPAEARKEAVAGATHVLVSHGHADHSADALAISGEKNIPAVGSYDLMMHWEARHGVKTIGFNKGGTVMLGSVAVTMVNAVHSSSFTATEDSTQVPVYAGGEAGFMIKAEGRCIYFSGDTDITADMEWMGDLHRPDIGILSAGGHFTMDMVRAAYAARRYFNFATVIPCHYRTFPFLAQSAQPLVDGLPGVSVIEPEVLKPITL